MEVIKIVVTSENAMEVLTRKQNGENICHVCVREAYEKIKEKVFVLPEES